VTALAGLLVAPNNSGMKVTPRMLHAWQTSLRRAAALAEREHIAPFRLDVPFMDEQLLPADHRVAPCVICDLPRAAWRFSLYGERDHGHRVANLDDALLGNVTMQLGYTTAAWRRQHCKPASVELLCDDCAYTARCYHAARHHNMHTACTLLQQLLATPGHWTDRQASAAVRNTIEINWGVVEAWAADEK
jgi:hypothetical protein